MADHSTYPVQPVPDQATAPMTRQTYPEGSATRCLVWGIVLAVGGVAVFVLGNLLLGRLIVGVSSTAVWAVVSVVLSIVQSTCLGVGAALVALGIGLRIYVRSLAFPARGHR